MTKIKYITPYETDASQIKGNAAGVLIPHSVGETINMVRANSCLVIRGGGTGLAGGCVPLNNSDVVLNLSKLNKITNFDRQRKTIEVEAGVILDELQDFLEQYNLEFPVNPSSHSICTIGGMIATNAVGARGVKYGNTAKWISWIDVIDSAGKIERKGVTEIPDYSGMEGITGVIVKAGLRLTGRKKRTASILSKEDFKEIIDVVRELKRNREVSMIEFFDKQVSEIAGLEKKYHLLIEFESGAGEFKDKEYEKLLELRDKVYPLLAKKGFLRIEDPKILLDRIGNVVEWLEGKNIPVFGHLGAGILHPCFSKEKEKLIPEMIKIVKRLGGQITGEHGIGLLKKEFVEANDKKILVNIKKRIDKGNKFNVGKVI